MDYTRRVVDDELDELFAALAAIALEGPKGVGKTATAQRRVLTLNNLDSGQRRAIIEADPSRVLAGERPVFIDEWQRVPEVWDVIRRQVDRDPRPGQFLLAGSAAPPEGAAIHSGAGRIVQLRVRPMSLAERLPQHPTVSLARVLQGDRPAISGEVDLTLGDYAHEIIASGFPGLRSLTGRAHRAQLDGYLARIVDRELPEQGLLVRRPAALRAWLTAYAAATASTASYNRILDAATSGDAEKPARSTVTGYREVLTRLWLLDPVPGWVPSRSPLTRLQQAPKHHLADPALAARLLGASVDSLLAGEQDRLVPRDGPLLGALFESLATLSVRVFAQAAEARVLHLRTRNGDHEVDLIVERDDGKVVAIEVKLAGTVTDRDVRHLGWLRRQLGERMLDGLVLSTGPAAYRRRDGFAVVPLGLLGP